MSGVELKAGTSEVMERFAAPLRNRLPFPRLRTSQQSPLRAKCENVVYGENKAEMSRARDKKEPKQQEGRERTYPKKKFTNKNRKRVLEDCVWKSKSKSSEKLLLLVGNLGRKYLITSSSGPFE
ncbi:hypothetical protein CEXT_43751 [Caerostris extrusa]|uniref:Uncharacterized protein n=1 Tax=Caerostris extrusa TaxID=172846 RepID=A0AAV4QXI3_CAEEX|nr:hypothetical protein CEXT_43751 [Caerostris extrusa]